MRYILQHIQTIIDGYNGGIPLAHFLKNYFRMHPKLGSRDRKTLSEMAYSWYRSAKGFDDIQGFEDKLQACLLLCSTQEKLVRPFLPETWLPFLHSESGDKLERIQTYFPFDTQALFPDEAALSDGIDRETWLRSMLVQPDLFIRIRKNKERILHILREHDIAYDEVTDTCLALPNGAAIDKLLPPDSYVVQDASSQETARFFEPVKDESWYDCCCGAGGKSLLLKDKEPGVHLTVSDKRESILHNLKTRFKQYRHTHAEAICVDVADEEALDKALGDKSFDHIICDVPCTGSGTWARTPEQLYFFEQEQLEKIAALQKSIVTNVMPYLKPRGNLFYITCSVFKEENEQVAQYAAAQTGLEIRSMQLISGIEKKADCMFTAVLKKPKA